MSARAARGGRVVGSRGAVGVGDDEGCPRPTGQAMLRVLPVGDILPSPYQPRQGIDPEGLGELTASIREHGILQPIVVRPVAGGFQLVAGERRWRAAQGAGMTDVPAVVRELSDRDAAVLALVENLQRSDLQFFEEAEAYRQLLEEFRLSQEELAEQVGKSQPAIANKVRLLRLEGPVRDRICREGLSERHARVLLRLDGEAERVAALETFVMRGLNVREAEEWVERRLRPKAPGNRRRVHGFVRDLRIYFNTFHQAAKGLQRAGYPVDLSSDEDDGGWTIRLHVGRREGGPIRKRGRA